LRELPLVAQVWGAHARFGERNAHARSRKFFAGPMATNARPGECLRKSMAGMVRRRTGPLSPRSPCATATSRWSRPRQIAIDGDGAACARHSGWRSRGNAARVPKIAARLVAPARRSGGEGGANAAAAESEPGSDLHASAEYRRHLAGVLAARRSRKRARARERTVSETLHAIRRGQRQAAIGQVPARLSLVTGCAKTFTHGTHIGCEHGICGACSVMLTATRAFLPHVRRAGERPRVTTVEGSRSPTAL